MSGRDVGSRWHELCDLGVRHVGDHLSSFYDAHLLMAYLGANSSQHVDEFLQSLQQYIRQVGFFVCPVVLFSLRMFVTHSLIFIVISDQSNGPGAGFSHIGLSVCLFVHTIKAANGFI